MLVCLLLAGAQRVDQALDADVAIAALEDLSKSLPTEDRIGVKSLVDSLRARQQEANEHLAGALATVEEGHLAERLAGLVAAGDPAR